MNSIYHAGLDGLRGILVLSVYLFHFYVSPYTKLGYMAVDVFFILSGFLVTGSYQKLSGSHFNNFKTFIKKRFFRIYPIYFIAVILISYLKSSPLQSVLAQLTFAFGFFMYDGTYLPNAVTWSLFNEEFFYLVFPIIIIKIKFWHSLLLLALGLICRLFVFKFAPAIETYTGDPYFIARIPPTTFFFFAAGVWLNFYIQKFKKEYLKHLFMMLILAFSYAVTKKNDLLFIWIAYLLIYLGIFIDKYNILKLSPLVWIGKHCYFIYLFQFITRDFMLGVGIPNDQFMGIINFVVLAVLAGLSMKYLEKPILKKYST